MAHVRPQRTWAENDMFRLLLLADRFRKSCGGLPPDFLSNLLALANFMRLSLLKAAHAYLFGASWQEIRVARLIRPWYAEALGD